MSVGAVEADKKHGGGPRKCWFRRFLWILGLGVGLPFVIFAFWSGLVLQTWRTYFPIVHYSESFADITVDGQRYHLTSVAKCERRYTATAGGLVHGGAYHTVKGGLLLHKRADGGGIVIVGPYLCSDKEEEHLLKTGDERTVELAKFFNSRSGVPPLKVLKLDDLSDPSLITAYWREYFEQPGADFQIHKIGYRAIKSGTVADDTKRIPFLKGRKRFLHPKYCAQGRANWVSYNTYVMPKEEWLQKGNLSYLNDIKELKSIPYSESLNVDGFKYVESTSFDINIKKIYLNDTENISVGKSYLVKIGDIKSEYKSINRYLNKHFFDIVSDKNQIQLNNTSYFYDPNSMNIRMINMFYFQKDNICAIAEAGNWP